VCSFSPDSSEAHIGWGGNLNGRLMASCVWNIRTENYTTSNVGDLSGTQCSLVDAGSTQCVQWLSIFRRFASCCIRSWKRSARLATGITLYNRTECSATRDCLVSYTPFACIICLPHWCTFHLCSVVRFFSTWGQQKCCFMALTPVQPWLLLSANKTAETVQP